MNFDLDAVSSKLQHNNNGSVVYYEGIERKRKGLCRSFEGR